MKMNLSQFLTLITVVFLIAACASKNSMSESNAKSAEPNSNQIKTNGQITFEAANDRYQAKGKFDDWHFQDFKMTKDNLETLKANIEVSLSSVTEKSPQLTAHLKAPDFFHVSKYSRANIEIANVVKVSDKNYTADMKLSMKGLSQKLESEFEVISESPLTVKGSAKIDRMLFGLGGSDLGVPDFVKVNYQTELPI